MLLSLFLASSVSVFCEIVSVIVNFLVIGFKASKPSTFFFLVYQFFYFFSNALPSGEYVNLALHVLL